MLKQLKALLATVPNDNLTLYQRENDMNHQTFDCELLKGITTNAYYLQRGKMDYVGNLIKKAEIFGKSAYAGSDTHEAALQGQLEYIKCQQVAEDMAKEFFDTCKTLYKEMAGLAWTPPVTREQRETNLRNVKATASQVELEKLVALRNA